MCELLGATIVLRDDRVGNVCSAKADVAGLKGEMTKHAGLLQNNIRILICRVRLFRASRRGLDAAAVCEAGTIGRFGFATRARRATTRFQNRFRSDNLTVWPLALAIGGARPRDGRGLNCDRAETYGRLVDEINRQRPRMESPT